jgi:hypothetical protein
MGVSDFEIFLDKLELTDSNCNIVSDFEYRHVEVSLASHVQFRTMITSEDSEINIILVLTMRGWF